MRRAKTAEECREEFLQYVRNIAEYWATLPDKTAQERCDGTVFSILNIFDGTSTELPAMNISLLPHPDDKQYRIKNDENWYRKGMVINYCHLHHMYYNKEATNDQE